VELDGNDLGVGAKVGVGGEDLPPAGNCDAADQEINPGAADASPPARITPVRGLFEILSGERFILKGPQLIAQSFELSRLSDSRQQLLANWPNEPSATVLNEFVQ
jgi:hypothetical protein